jgi:hypothetical protein
LYALFISSMDAICPIILSSLILITMILFGKEQKSWGSSLCSFLHPPLTSSFLVQIFWTFYSKTPLIYVFFYKDASPKMLKGLLFNNNVLATEIIYYQVIW